MAKAGGAFRVTVQGDKKLLAKLNRLGRTEANKVIRTALRAGSKTIADETKRLAPVGQDRGSHKKGTLKRAIKVRAMKRKRGRIGTMVQIGQGFFKGATFYGGFVALGHKIGSRKLGGSRGQVPANEFMKTAVKNKEKQVLSQFGRDVGAGIEKAMK